MFDGCFIVELRTMKDQFKEILDSLDEKVPRSRLAPYRDLLIELRRRMYTYREIRQILREKCQVQVSVSTLHDFLQAQRKTKRIVRTTAILENQKPQGEKLAERKTIPVNTSTPKNSAPAASHDEVRKRIAALKQRQTQPEQDKRIFEYDPDQPLHIESNDVKKDIVK